MRFATMFLILSLTATMNLCASEPLSQSVSTNSVVLLPPISEYGGVAWSTNVTAVQGQVLVYDTGVRYMALVAGALPAAPTSDYREVYKQPRGFATIQNTGSTTLWLSFGEAAVVDKGLKLVAGASVTLKDYDGLVAAVSSAAGGTAAMTDVPGK